MKRILLLSFVVLLTSAAMTAEQKHAPTRVTIDQHNRLLLNGKPWFPLCLSPGPPHNGKDPLGRDALDAVKAGGIDSFRVGGKIGQDGAEVVIPAEYVDWIAKHKMYAFINLRELSVLDPGVPDRKSKLRATIERYRMNPALALWKSMDEPTVGKSITPVDQMQAAYKLIKEVDPDHPVWLNHSPGGFYNYRLYRDVCDITGVDVYPVSVPKGVASKLPNKGISCIGDYMDIVTKAVDGKKPAFMVLQIGWSGATPPKHIRIFPTLRQERYMTYQAIINGARGLLFFGSDRALMGKDAELGFNWTFWNDVLKPILREIGEGSELHSALLVPDSKLPVKASGGDDLEFTAREVGPFLYILAAKREGGEKDIRFKGAMIKGEVEVMFEDRTIEVINGSFVDFFRPNDVHVYKVRLR